MSLNKLKVQALNIELDKLLKEFASKHGLSHGNQRISYAADGSNMKLTVEFGDKSITGDINPVYYKDCARNGWQHGLSTSMIGKQVKLSRGMMTFSGMKGKYAILQADDKRFWKYDPALIATALKGA